MSEQKTLSGIKWIFVMFVLVNIGMIVWQMHILKRERPLHSQMRESQLPNSMQIVQTIHSGIDAAIQRANDLSKKGQHKEAAYILMDVVGANNLCVEGALGVISNDLGLSNQPTTKLGSKPSTIELMTLHEFRKASISLSSAYEELLINKYPDCKADLAVQELKDSIEELKTFNDEARERFSKYKSDE